MTTITETDKIVITETKITESIQITGNVVTATTEIPTVHFQIHDRRISPDHHIIVSKFGVLVTVRALAKYPPGTLIGFVELFKEFSKLLCYSCFSIFFRC